MKKTISGTLLPILLILISALLIAILPTEAEAMIYEDTVRLHIRARSDSEKDQRIKLSVRDRLLSEYGGMLYGSDSADIASAVIEESLSDIERALQRFCDDEGYGCKISATFDTEWFDTRVYEDCTLPSGYYRSLIINIDGGEGRNWWCVMYPPLCLDIATADEGYSESENALISRSGYSVKFKLLEGISGLFK